jgi:HEAT repeat protein
LSVCPSSEHEPRILVDIGKPACPVLIRALSDENSQVVYRSESVLATIGRDAVPELLLALEKDKVDERTKISIIQLLSKIGDVVACPPLVRALGDKDIHFYAQIALGKFGEQAKPSLLEGLSASEPEVRSGVAEAIGYLKIAEAHVVQKLIHGKNHSIYEFF